MKIKVNLGSGYKKRTSTEEELWINIDNNSYAQPDILRDLNKGLPFNNQIIDEIFSEHLLEHIKDFRFLMEECYRVLKNGGKFRYIVPYALKGTSGFRHFEHCNFFTDDWYKFFTEYAEYNDYQCRFKFIKQELKQDIEGGWYLEGEFERMHSDQQDNSWKQMLINIINNVCKEDKFMILIQKNDTTTFQSNLTEEGQNFILKELLKQREKK